MSRRSGAATWGTPLVPDMAILSPWVVQWGDYLPRSDLGHYCVHFVHWTESGEVKPMRRWSLARQMFALQIVVVVATVAAGTVMAVLQTRDLVAEGRDRGDQGGGR